MLSKDEVISLLREYFREKADQYQIDLAFVFGSYARGYLKEESDVDVAVVFAREVDTDEKRFRAVTDISVELGSRVGVNVDVISIDESFKKPALYYNAVVLGVPVYIRDKTRYIQIYNQALFQMNDFEIFGSRFQFEAAKANLRGMMHG